MKLPDQSDEPVRTAKLVHNLPQAIMVDGVKGIAQVHKGGVEADILFLILLLQLPCSEHNTYCSTAMMKARLTLASFA